VYKQITPKHIVYLKAVRAVSSLHSLTLLYNKGLFIDAGTIIRCIYECLSEICFLLEHYPSTNQMVDQYVRYFTSTSLIESEEEAKSVLIKKIHSAHARILQSQLNFSDCLKHIRNIHKTYCGYVHSNYPHIMEIYGGPPEKLKFNISGVNNADRKRAYVRTFKETVKSVEFTMGFIAHKLGFKELFNEIKNNLG
jgi:hypothetical protein